MEVQKPADLIRFLKDHIEPLEDEIYGQSYRAAVYLKDGTFIPCVIFRNFQLVTQLAFERFRTALIRGWTEKKIRGVGYAHMIRHFSINNKRVKFSEIKKIEPSSFAFPNKFLQLIETETGEGWTGFTCKMKDGKYIGFKANYTFEFFFIPNGYHFTDIEMLINHSYVLKNGELKHYQVPMPNYPFDQDRALVNYEMPFFECYLDHI